MAFLNISSPTYLNLVRSFFSNAKLEHDESVNTVTAITSFLMETPIHLTIKEVGGYLHLSFEANTSTWLKSDHPTEHEDDDVDPAFEDFLAQEHAPPPTSSLHFVQPSLKVNSAMLDAIHSLSNEVWGLRE
ncbi:hypothetical protein J1N35_004874 [Gossypium stocksii]|uniref:Uncharacterized protein n=1 Tax=Gossypium stocksii TaxID=47602 RepID=A0A9D4AI37_9ROSI|nr:hypothetical protein J1N35_004874 [Gossypium stocksii]